MDSCCRQVYHRDDIHLGIELKGEASKHASTALCSAVRPVKIAGLRAAVYPRNTACASGHVLGWPSRARERSYLPEMPRTSAVTSTPSASVSFTARVRSEEHTSELQS